MNSKKKLNQVSENSLKIGNKAFKKYETKGGLKDGNLAVRAYNAVLRAEGLKLLIY